MTIVGGSLLSTGQSLSGSAGIARSLQYYSHVLNCWTNLVDRHSPCKVFECSIYFGLLKDVLLGPQNCINSSPG
ncbi:hypothetical protein PM082_019676 [Marasmius tenuissimus]|nr:hypothetical protein PM082_019676 [Marasmius tenuissimus]